MGPAVVRNVQGRDAGVAAQGVRHPGQSPRESQTTPSCSSRTERGSGSPRPRAMPGILARFRTALGRGGRDRSRVLRVLQGRPGPPAGFGSVPGDISDLPALRIILSLPEEPALKREWTWRQLHNGEAPAWVHSRPPSWLKEPEINWRDPRLPVEFRGMVIPGYEDVAREWMWPDLN